MYLCLTRDEHISWNDLHVYMKAGKYRKLELLYLPSTILLKYHDEAGELFPVILQSYNSSPAFCYTLNNTYTKVCKVSSQCCNVHICVWRSKWDLLLNPTKSYWHFHFQFSQVRKFTPDQQYFICNNPVSNDQNIKDL